jgi:hypothetical protein
MWVAHDCLHADAAATAVTQALCTTSEEKGDSHQMWATLTAIHAPAEQDTIAALILEEIADDARWEAAFAASHPEIEQLAERVRAKIRSGQTRDMRIEDL